MAIIRNAALCLWLSLGFVGLNHAAPTFTVNSSLDELDADLTDGVCRSVSGVCTLRAAVMQANVLTGPGVVINLPPGTYPLLRPVDVSHIGTGGALTLTDAPNGMTPISIVGTNAATTIIDGSQIDRVFTIFPVRTASLVNLTVRNGYEPSDDGGGIDNEGVLTLDHVVVTGNYASTGGGVANEISATMYIMNSTIMSNVAYSGAGLYSAGTLFVNASTFAVNESNSAGGLYLDGNATLINTTIAGNRAIEDGGGIYVNLFNDAFLNIYNSTIAFNFADSDANNSGSGGGVHSISPRPNFNIYNTIIAGNYHINPAFADDCDGRINTHAYNRFGNTSQCQITQISGAYALLNSLDDLSALQDNGGPTQTIALLAGSNAINGAAATCLDSHSTPITTDQRGFPRNVGNCDIGAYEFDPNDKIFKNGFDVVAGK